MIVFGWRSFWLFVAVLTFTIAAALVAAGNVILAVALVAIVVIGAIYSLRGRASN